MVERFLRQSRYAHFQWLYELFDRLIRQRKWNQEWEAISRTQEHELSARPSTRRKEDAWGKTPTNIIRLLENVLGLDQIGKQQSINGKLIVAWNWIVAHKILSPKLWKYTTNLPENSHSFLRMVGSRGP